MLRSRHTILAAAALTAGITAQVPDGYLLMTKRSGSENGVYMLDPASGVETRVFSRADGQTMTDGIGVCLDPNASGRAFATGSDGGFGFGANAFTLLFPEENNVTPTSGKFTITGFPGFTFPREVELANSTTLVTAVSGGSNNGLWTIDLITRAGASAIVIPVNSMNGNGFVVDIDTIGENVYMVTEAIPRTAPDVSAPSEVYEWNSLLGTTRVVATGLTQDLKSVGVHDGRLLVGDAAGDIHEVDLTTGALTTFLATGLGLPITEIASKGGANDPIYIVAAGATDDSLYDSSDLANAIFTYTGDIRQVAVGFDTGAVQLAYGEGCDTSQMTTPHHRYLGAPALGNAGFAVGLGGGLPTAPVALHVGASRTVWSGGDLPFPLDIIGMPGCNLYTEPFAVFGAATDMLGNASVPLPIPGDLSLSGLRLYTQWVLVDSTANALGIVASEGEEHIVR